LRCFKGLELLLDLGNSPLPQQYLKNVYSVGRANIIIIRNINPAELLTGLK